MINILIILSCLSNLISAYRVLFLPRLICLSEYVSFIRCLLMYKNMSGGGRLKPKDEKERINKKNQRLDITLFSLL